MRYFGSDRQPSAIFITAQNEICQSQIYPFYFFRQFLARDLEFYFQEIPLPNGQNILDLPHIGPEIVFFQPWWDIDPQRLQAILCNLRKEKPLAKIVFMDSYAPTDLRLAEVVDTSIDLYLKKHVLRDRSRYGLPTKGDTNLVDYYGKLYGFQYPETRFIVPSGLLDKLIVGPSFATANYLLPNFMGSAQPMAFKREIDIHARFNGNGTGWYGRMREHASEKAKNISGVRIATGRIVSHRSYMREMRASKMCFSPFGYGEICWRDYEAVMNGAVLIKPDMSHVETEPDIFQAFKTYVPVNWDFSDLEEKVRYYLGKDTERNMIAQNAFSVISSYFKNGEFLKHVSRILNRLGKGGSH